MDSVNILLHYLSSVCVYFHWFVKRSIKRLLQSSSAFLGLDSLVTCFEFCSGFHLDEGVSERWSAVSCVGLINSPAEVPVRNPAEKLNKLGAGPLKEVVSF